MLDLSKFTIPPGAKWAAADSTGTVYAYEDVPYRAAVMWIDAGGNCWHIGEVDPATINWRDSLTPVQPAGASNETA